MKLFGNKRSSRAVSRSAGSTTRRGNTVEVSVNPPGERRRRKKRRGGRTLLTLFILAAVVVSGYAFLKNYIAPPPIVEQDIPTPNVNDNQPSSINGRKTGVYTMIVAGTDLGDYHTDTLMVVYIDTNKKEVNALSIPRDTLVDVTRSTKKINSAYGIGGGKNIEQLKTEMAGVLGFKPDFYAVCKLKAFEELIDAVGGVYIDVPRDMKYSDPYQNLVIDIKKGAQVLDGKNAIGYMRYRKGYAEGDLGRIDAQHVFLSELAKKLTTPAIITKLPQLAKIFVENVNTDLSLGNLIWLANEMKSIDPSTVKFYRLPGVPDTYNKLSYYFVDEENTKLLINDKFNPFDEPIEVLGISSIKPPTARFPNIDWSEV